MSTPKPKATDGGGVPSRNDGGEVTRHLTLVSEAQGQPHEGTAPLRYWQLDMLRGIAVISMVTYHLAFDLNTFCEKALGGPLNLPQWFWRFAPECIGTMFFLAMGASAWLKSQEQGGSGSYKPFYKRGGELILVAIGITVGTALFPAHPAVYFGVIHCMALTTFLIIPFLRKTALALTMGAAITLIGVYFQQIRVSFPHLMWLGLLPETGNMGGDYYPIFPWLGVALLGISMGRILQGRRLLSPYNRTHTTSPAFSAVCFLGRHSLIIYLTHQPIILAVLGITGLAAF